MSVPYGLKVGTGHEALASEVSTPKAGWPFMVLWLVAFVILG